MSSALTRTIGSSFLGLPFKRSSALNADQWAASPRESESRAAKGGEKEKGEEGVAVGEWVGQEGETTPKVTELSVLHIARIPLAHPIGLYQTAAFQNV